LKPKDFAIFAVFAAKIAKSLRRQPRKFENLTLVARQREHFWRFWRILLLLNSIKKRGVLIHKILLASSQLVSSQRRVAL